MEGIFVKVLINRTYIKTSLFAVAFNTAQTQSNLRTCTGDKHNFLLYSIRKVYLSITLLIQ